jgi:hypothetical protein
MRFFRQGRITNIKMVISELTLTIFSHCVPLPAPGAPRTNTKSGFIAELMARVLIPLNKRLIIHTAITHNDYYTTC